MSDTLGQGFGYHAAGGGAVVTPGTTPPHHLNTLGKAVTTATGHSVSMTVTHTANVGDSVLVGYVTGVTATRIFTITDSAGNTWTRDATELCTGLFRLILWRCTLTHALVATVATITVTYNGAPSGQPRFILAASWAGIVGTDGFAAGQLRGFTALPLNVSFTPTQTGDVFISFCAEHGPGAGTTTPTLAHHPATFIARQQILAATYSTRWAIGFADFGTRHQVGRFIRYTRHGDNGTLAVLAVYKGH